MSNRDKWFLSETAERAKENAKPILPTFLRDSFLFKVDEEPEHTEAQPTVPNYPNTYEVYDESRSGNKWSVAVDVPTFAMASLLAHARVEKVESELKLHHYTDDVWIVSPDGTHTRMYRGVDED
jgi:hypothetical protein